MLPASFPSSFFLSFAFVARQQWQQMQMQKGKALILGVPYFKALLEIMLWKNVWMTFLSSTFWDMK